MKIIAVTGKSGSGKSTLGKLLAQRLECKYVSIDEIGHEALYNPDAKASLCEAFGDGILVDGKVSRKKVGQIVFADKKAMDKLTEITWGYMQDVLDVMLEGSNEYIVFDWALLPNSKYWNMAYKKIIVSANEQIRKARIMKRDNISEEYFELREAASWNYQDEVFDYIFENEFTDESLNMFVENFILEIRG